jgi:hypothetical protein
MGKSVEGRKGRQKKEMQLILLPFPFSSLSLLCCPVVMLGRYYALTLLSARCVA